MNLSIDKLQEISNIYGDSFYILDTEQFKINFNELQEAFRNIYPNTYIAYSYKTNYTPRLCKVVDRLGGFAEVVSDMEYDIAKKLGVEPEKIYFNGPYKKAEAVKELLLAGGTVNVDSDYDLEIVKEVAINNPEHNLSVGIRCNFDVQDGVLSRFGFDVNSKEFEDAIDTIRQISNLKLDGLHSHFATRSIKTWPQRATGILELVDKYFEEAPRFLSLGGGLYGKMADSLKAQFDVEIPTYEDYANAVANQFKAYFKEKGKQPMLLIEPGSALVGDAMKFAAKVVSIKDVRDKKIATLLGSIYNINPTLNKKNPPIKVYHNEDNDKEQLTYEDLDFGGFTCIESDYLYRGFSGELAVGDYVVFGNVGSYSVVLKPPFILPNFPMVECNNDTDEIYLIKRKECFDDLFHTFKFEF
ncbi:pyridoxal-dependent decarboxylase [Senegalia sp. (in: firmicutes)]|uniref:pyridoxal-dependent decarboxylase n=1 Tax=Senegalia sp. (in: firmicutes) TaxID=1924098 RepID=UPI003F9E6F68